MAEVALQAAALWPGVRLSPDLARGLAACRPEAEWSACLDVLSIQEALRCIETV